MTTINRRHFIRELGVGVATLPFLLGLPSLRAETRKQAQRIVFIFSPNGVVPNHFWPDEEGSAFTLKRILAPLEPFKDRTLILKGLANKIRGDGDGHMRGMSCLLTGIELLRGNIQGGSHTPAGWASGISIDQELKNRLQREASTRTRFGSLELGVGVPNRADPWTRWTYAGSDQPIPPISDPYQLFDKLYGSTKERENLVSILDDLTADLRHVSANLPAEDKAFLEKHTTFVREIEKELQNTERKPVARPAPVLEPDVANDNDNLPKLFKLQSDLLVNALANDMARVATLQFTNSVGQARFRWLGIEEGHHSLSHDPDLNEGSQEKLVKINTWICEQIAGLARSMDKIPEPGGDGTMLDHTTLLWTNELGKGNSHALTDIPFVLVGGGLGFKAGRSVRFQNLSHNRLWLSIAHAFGHEIETFGNPSLCKDGPLPQMT